MDQLKEISNFVNDQITDDIWALLGKNATSNTTGEQTTPPVETEMVTEMENLADLATEILGKLDQKKETAAAHLGISAAEVETMPFDLTALEQSGIFLNIDATGFSVLSRQLDW